MKSPEVIIVLYGCKNHFHISGPLFTVSYTRLAQKSLPRLLFKFSQFMVYLDNPVGLLIMTSASQGTSLAVVSLVFGIGLLVTIVSHSTHNFLLTHSPHRQPLHPACYHIDFYILPYADTGLGYRFGSGESCNAK